MFSTLLKTNFSLGVTFILLSANGFDLEKSKILSFSKALPHYHTTIFETGPYRKQKRYAEDKIHLTEKVKFMLGENAYYQHFLLFPLCFL